MSFLVFFLPLWPSHQVKALHAACCLLEALIYTGYKKTQFSSFLFSFYSPFYWISQFTYICEKNTSAPWRTSPTPCCHYEMLNLLRSIEEYTSKCARGTNTVITRQSLEIKALELSSKSSTSMSKVSKTSYRWVSKCVDGLSENVKKDPHTIYSIWYFQASVLIWHLWSSGTLNVRQLPSTSKVSGRMPGGRSRLYEPQPPALAGDTLPEPLQDGTEPEKLHLLTYFCHIRTFHTAFS